MNGKTTSIYLSNEVIKLMDELGVQNRSKFVNDVLKTYLTFLKQLLDERRIERDTLKIVMENPHSFAFIFIRFKL
jgi:metal-responsive CopG/Arc/MetJ family transcriptional regulator